MNSNYKIFGLGLSRTGTKSLTDALGILGFDILHYPNDEVTLQELRSNTCNFTVLQHADGITDITVVPFYPTLDVLFPGSKFILTIRDQVTWLASLEKHWDYAAQMVAKATETELRDCEINWEVTQLLKMAVFGSYKFDQEHMINVYNCHVQKVASYFHNRPQDLLVMDICGGDDWEKLCPFLGCPVLEKPFPYITTDQQLLQRSQHRLTLTEC